MLEVKRYKNERNSFDYYIKNEDNTFKILFGGNLDLYFCVNRKDDENNNEIINFEITKENYVLYSLFEQLYNKIINCDVHTIDDFELELYDEEEINAKINTYKELNEELKDSYAYKDLVKDNVISWRHDDQIYEEANILNIYKEEEKFRLEFILQTKEWSAFIDVRFRNSGSRYNPFHMIFMQFYNKLLEYDPENHQIHIEEYLYQKKLTKKI